jgi:hypothetical protein
VEPPTRGPYADDGRSASVIARWPSVAPSGYWATAASLPLSAEMGESDPECPYGDQAEVVSFGDMAAKLRRCSHDIYPATPDLRRPRRSRSSGLLYLCSPRCRARGRSSHRPARRPWLEQQRRRSEPDLGRGRAYRQGTWSGPTSPGAIGRVLRWSRATGRRWNRKFKLRESTPPAVIWRHSPTTSRSATGCDGCSSRQTQIEAPRTVLLSPLPQSSRRRLLLASSAPTTSIFPCKMRPL